MWCIWANGSDNLQSAEQTIACNTMLMRNDLLTVDTIVDAFKIWAFCMFKYPQTTIHLKHEDKQHAITQ